MAATCTCWWDEEWRLTPEDGLVLTGVQRTPNPECTASRHRPAIDDGTGEVAP